MLPAPRAYGSGHAERGLYSARMAVTRGSRIGHFEIVAALGAGGMGEVYRARDTKLDRDVALKLLPDTFAADPERLRRFEREAKTLASLNFQAKILPDGTIGTPSPVFADADVRVRGFDVSPDGRLLAFTQENSDTQLLTWLSRRCRTCTNGDR